MKTQNTINLCQVSLKRDLSLILKNYQSFKKFYEKINIYIICPSKDLAHFKEQLNSDEFRIISEDEIISFKEFELIFIKESENISYQSEFRKRLSWYYQQILKISFMINFINEKKENLIIWDADTILLKKIDFFSGDKSINYGNFNEFHKQYYATNKKILNDFPKYFISFLNQFISATVEEIFLFEKKIFKNIVMYRLSKRFLDIIVSLISLIILLPIFTIVIIILLLSAEGEVFYFQERIGLNNSKFKIWKFATMLKNSLNLGSGSITLEDDFRVTKPGKFLRKTKINELPQLINILKGDISLVGPRPLVEQSFKMYSEEIQSKLYKVKPGLTGIGSIVFRDEESLISNNKDGDIYEFYKKVISPYKGELEMWYQKNRSFSLDIQLILITAWTVIFSKSKLYEKWFKGLPKRNHD